MMGKKGRLTSISVALLAVVLILSGCVGGVNKGKFTLSVNVQGEGSVDPPAGQYRYDQNAVVELKAAAHAGWKFSHWLGEVDDPANEKTYTLMDKDKDVTAVFVEEGPAPPYSLSGIVIDADGEPLAGVTVSFEPQHLTAITDANGSWEMHDVQGGTRIEASLPGYTFSPGGFDVDSSEDEILFVGIPSSPGAQDIVLSDVTRLTPKSEVGNIVALSSDQIVFADSTAFVDSLDVGSVIVLDSAPGMDGGILAKVTSISGDRTTVELEPAVLEDVIDLGTISTSQTMSAEYVAQHFRFSDGVRVLSTGDPFKRAFEYKPEDGVTLSGHVIIRESSRVDVDLSFWGRLREFEFVCDLGIDMELQMLLERQKNWKYDHYVLGYIDLMPIHVWGPLYLEPSIALVAGTEGNVKAKLETSVTYQRGYSVGARYTAGVGWERIWRETGQGFNYTPPFVDGNFAALAYVGPEVECCASLLAVGSAGVNLGLYAYANAQGEIHVELTDPSDWLGHYNLDVWLKSSLWFDLELLGICRTASPTWNWEPFRTNVVYGMSGRVTDADGQPVEGVEIIIEGASQPSKTVLSNSSGCWHDLLVRGPVQVKPRCEGYTFEPASVSISRGRSDVHFTAHAAPVSAYEGRVLIAGKQPGKSIAVRLRSPGRPEQTVITDSGGRYTIPADYQPGDLLSVAVRSLDSFDEEYVSRNGLVTWTSIYEFTLDRGVQQLPDLDLYAYGLELSEPKANETVSFSYRGKIKEYNRRVDPAYWLYFTDFSGNMIGESRWSFMKVPTRSMAG